MAWFEASYAILVATGGALSLVVGVVCIVAIKGRWFLSEQSAFEPTTPLSRQNLVASVCQMAKNPCHDSNEEKCKEMMDMYQISPNEKYGLPLADTKCPKKTENLNCVIGSQLEKDAILPLEMERSSPQLTPFLCACVGGSLDLINFMLQRGADPSVVNEDGDGPLYVATFGVICRFRFQPLSPVQRSFEIRNLTLILDALIDAGCDVDASNCSMYRPLHLAAASGHRWLVEILLFRGADPWVRNNFGLRPYDCALLRGHQRVAALLKDSETKFDWKKIKDTRCVTSFSD